MENRVLTTVCVVGDQFAAFAAHPAVRTVSTFVAEVRTGAYDQLPGLLSICWGQGISSYDRQFVSDRLRLQGLLDSVVLEAVDPPVVARSWAHKQREANVVLAGLQQISADGYRASLRLHPDNEFLLDHQTGEHVQGMVVIEAIRQMGIAVCEQFFAASWPERSYCYLWHSMELRYESFLFPVHAEVDCVTSSVDLADPVRLRITAEVTVHQAGNKCASAHVEYTAFDNDSLAGAEHRLAGRTLKSVLAGPAPVESPPALLEVG